MNKNKISIAILFLLLATTLSAAPIGEQRAREIATKFFLQSGTRSATPVLRLDWAGKDAESVDVVAIRSSANTSATDDALLYVYNRVDTKGFVIVSGEDKYENAIIGFSHDNRFDTENMADGAKWMLWAWSKQLAAIRSEVRPQSATRAIKTTTGSNYMVCDYRTALWDQDSPFKDESPTFGGVKTRIGCVTTALAIMVYHHKWPERGVGTTPAYSYTPAMEISVGRQTIPENKLGRPYNYSKMLWDYSNGYTKEEGAAVAALFYDIGTAVQARFSTKNTTPIEDWEKAMATHFRYSKAAIKYEAASFTQEEWIEMLKRNISKCGPTIFRGSRPGGGHAFILDGYTTDNRFSVNYGWGGSSNGCYLLPEIQYYIDQAAIFDLVPDRDGTSTYKDYLTLITKTTTSGNVYKGLRTDETKYEVGKSFKSYVAFYNSGNVDFNGTVCIAHCDKEGEIKEILWSSSKISNLATEIGWQTTPTLTLSKSIAQGDCLRAFYKGTASDAKWERARRTNNNAYDEVLLKATPAEVAKTLNLSYKKETKELVFSSQNALQYTVKNSSSKVIESNNVSAHTSTTIDLSSYKAGKYTFSFASGGEPYVITITL